jgi:type IV secretory pathway VirB10-like protein
MIKRPALLLGLALVTAACGKKEEAATNDAVAQAGLEQENVIANDVTAIDAATADDARMAADMPAPADGELANLSANLSNSSEAKPKKAPARKPAAAAPKTDEAAPGAAGNDAG